MGFELFGGWGGGGGKLQVLDAATEATMLSDEVEIRAAEFRKSQKALDSAYGRDFKEPGYFQSKIVTIVSINIIEFLRIETEIVQKLLPLALNKLQFCLIFIIQEHQ